MEKRIRTRNTTVHSPNTDFTILALDPSMTAWGWVVLDSSGRLLESGCIKTEPSNKKLRIRKADDKVRRIEEINAVFIPIIHKYKIQLILSELPHGSQSAVAACMLCMVTGIAQTIADCFRIAIEWYSEGDVKSFLFHRQSVSKLEMKEMMKKNFPGKHWTGIDYRDEAVADALAIYSLAYNKSSIIKFACK